MCRHKYLSRILLLIFTLIPASCSDNNGTTRPSLNADNLWDQMEEERKKPLPIMVQPENQQDESGEILPVSSSILSSDSLSREDIEAYQEILTGADKKYQAIRTVIEQNFVNLALEAATKDVVHAQWRTIQLHLSRLTRLHKNMNQAINSLDEAEKKSHDLRIIIAEYITRTRSRLEAFDLP